MTILPAPPPPVPAGAVPAVQILATSTAALHKRKAAVQGGPSIKRPCAAPVPSPTPPLLPPPSPPVCGQATVARRKQMDQNVLTRPLAPALQPPPPTAAAAAPAVQSIQQSQQGCFHELHKQEAATWKQHRDSGAAAGGVTRAEWKADSRPQAVASPPPLRPAPLPVAATCVNADLWRPNTLHQLQPLVSSLPLTPCNRNPHLGSELLPAAAVAAASDRSSNVVQGRFLPAASQAAAFGAAGVKPLHLSSPATTHTVPTPPPPAAPAASAADSAGLTCVRSQAVQYQVNGWRAARGTKLAGNMVGAPPQGDQEVAMAVSSSKTLASNSSTMAPAAGQGVMAGAPTSAMAQSRGSWIQWHINQLQQLLQEQQQEDRGQEEGDGQQQQRQQQQQQRWQDEDQEQPIGERLQHL